MIGKHENNHKKKPGGLPPGPVSSVVAPRLLVRWQFLLKKELRQEKGTVKRVGNAADNRVLHNHMGSPPFLSA